MFLFPLKLAFLKIPGNNGRLAQLVVCLTTILSESGGCGFEPRAGQTGGRLAQLVVLSLIHI